MEKIDLEGVANAAREGNPVTMALVALAGAVLLIFGFKLARFAVRLSGMVSTIITVLGVILWLRDQFARRDQPDRGPA